MSQTHDGGSVLLAKTIPPSLGTAMVWGMPLTDAAQLFLTALMIMWWLVLFAEKIYSKITRKRNRRRSTD